MKQSYDLKAKVFLLKYAVLYTTKVSLFSSFLDLLNCYRRFHDTATPALKSLRPIIVLVDSSPIKQLVIQVLNDELWAFYEANGKF